MSVASKLKNNKNTKLIVLAVVMAVVAGGLAFASTHNSKQTTKKDAAKKASSTGTRTVTTKPSSADQVKTNQERFQNHIDSAIKQKRITETQAKLIQAKAAEVAKTIASKQDPKARAEMQKDLYAWARDNKIPLSFVFEMSRPRA